MKFQAKYATALASTLLIVPFVFGNSAVAATSVRGSEAVLDFGAAPATDVKDIMISLKVVNRPDLESFIASTVDRTSPNYRKFITPAQFATRYGQSPAALTRVQAFLKAHGLTVTKVYENNLMIGARGTNAQLSSVFGTAIHSVTANGESYQRPAGKVTIPRSIADVVVHVAGLSTKTVYHTNLKTVPALAMPVKQALANKVRPANAMPTPGIPQQYTVNDLAKQNNITPLYARGLTGAGTTLGIMTFASFKTTDVSAYWTGVGISGSTTRITTINTVPGSTISTNGADETTLDVEQSGGVASGANVIVYEAPNNAAGELALYTGAITANKADTLSISWGSPEVAEDPTAEAQLDTLFMESAAQGVPIMAASADSGSYDLNNTQNFPYPDYSATLSVDFPGSSPYIISAGGTTLPVTLNLTHGTIVVPAERPWAWDYLQSYIVTNDGSDYFYTNIFPVGGGGGVSVNYLLPSFQVGLAGTQVSAPGQSLFCFANPPAGTAQPCTPGEDLEDMPAGVVGRNVPDVSLNADPETGYSLYFSQVGDKGNHWSTGSGGTSFVAPQLNGIFSLITQQNGKRLGWLHPQLYGAFKTQGYATGSPFRAITTGDNWFYVAGPNPGYNPGSGIGTLDVDNLSKALAD